MNWNLKWILDTKTARLKELNKGKCTHYCKHHLSFSLNISSRKIFCSKKLINENFAGLFFILKVAKSQTEAVIESTSKRSFKQSAICFQAANCCFMILPEYLPFLLLLLFLQFAREILHWSRSWWYSASICILCKYDFKARGMIFFSNISATGREDIIKMKKKYWSSIEFCTCHFKSFLIIRNFLWNYSRLNDMNFSYIQIP